MDIEKTLGLLVENAAQQDARQTALEKNLLALTNGLGTLTTVVETIVDEMRKMDARSRERDLALDEHVEKLIQAIDTLVSGRVKLPPRVN